MVITGATGLLGGALARKLSATGVEVVALVRPATLRSGLPQQDWRIREGDVLEPDSLKGVFEGADALVHAAGMLGRAGVPEAAYHELHVSGAQNVLSEAARTRPSPRVLFISSPGVLGPVDGKALDESAPLAPSNAYERSKAAAEGVARRFAAEGLPLVIVRPEFVYGPHDRHVLGLFSAVQRGVFFYVSGGSSFCHPTYLEDAVAGMSLCLLKGQPGEIYHVAGPRPVTFRELGATMADALGTAHPRLSLPRSLAWMGAATVEGISRIVDRQAPLSRDGVAFFSENRCFSWEKARRELGYQPQFDLKAGVEATVSWYREHGWLP